MKNIIVLFAAALVMVACSNTEDAVVEETVVDTTVVETVDTTVVTEEVEVEGEMSMEE
jgi:PBP1b-binding outer membrane lipoprotein LpoB